MGAKPLLITQKQVAAVLKGAAAAGVFYEIRIENGAVQFVPCSSPKAEKVDEPRGWHL